MIALIVSVVLNGIGLLLCVLGVMRALYGLGLCERPLLEEDR